MGGQCCRINVSIGLNAGQWPALLDTERIFGVCKEEQFMDQPRGILNGISESAELYLPFHLSMVLCLYVQWVPAVNNHSSTITPILKKI
jgi:hypothetical protein